MNPRPHANGARSSFHLITLILWHQLAVPTSSYGYVHGHKVDLRTQNGRLSENCPGSDPVVVVEDHAARSIAQRASSRSGGMAAMRPSARRRRAGRRRHFALRPSPVSITILPGHPRTQAPSDLVFDGGVDAATSSTDVAKLSAKVKRRSSTQPCLALPMR